MNKTQFLRHFSRMLLVAALLVPGWQVTCYAQARELAQGKEDIYTEYMPPWKWYHARSGQCGRNENDIFPYCGLNGSDYTIVSHGNCCNGLKVTQTTKDRKVIFYGIYKATFTLPPCAKMDFDWEYKLYPDGNKGDRRVLIYKFDTWQEADSIYVSNTPYRSATENATSKKYLVYETTTNTNATLNTRFTFDNSHSSSTQEVSRYFMLVGTMATTENEGYVEATIKTISQATNMYYPSLNGSGTKESPLQITTASDLKHFAAIVNSGVEGTNKLYAVLTSDIDYSNYTDVSAMIGTSSYPYQGVFDGQGHTITTAISCSEHVALFRYVNGATIQNLELKGSLQSSSNVSAALIGDCRGTTSISNVIVRSKIISTASGALGNAGLVAMGNDSKLTITNCGFAGSLICSNSAQGKECAGFVGSMSSGGNVTLTNCYFAPDTIQNISASNSATFVRLSNTRTITNCYYTKDFGTVQGTKVSNTQMASGEICWRLNGSKNDGTPWLQTLGEDNVPCLWDALHVYEQNGSYFNFQPSFRGAGTEADPFQIENVLQLEKFRDLVNTSYTTLCARLVADIDLANRNWEPIGRKFSNDSMVIYNGVFDGNGYTIHNLNVNTGVDHFNGFFGYVDGATIKNVILHNVTIHNSLGNHVGVIAGRAANTTFQNCASYGILHLTGDGSNFSGIARAAENVTMTSCYTTYSVLSTSSPTIQYSYCGQNVANWHASGELTYKLNNGAPSPWVQTLGRDEYPLLRGAISVYKNNSGYYNDKTSVGGEAGYIQTTSGKDFRVIHHGGRLYEFVFTVATQDGNGVHTMPDANIRYYSHGEWVDILQLSAVNADTLDFSKDWWGALRILQGTTVDTRTYDKQVPSFWARQGNHKDCKQASLLWVAPKDITELPTKFAMKGADESSKLDISSNEETPVAPNDDASVVFTDPTIGIAMEGAGHQAMMLTATYSLYAVSVWDATDNCFVAAMTSENGTSTATIDLPQLESYHNMVVLAYSKTIDTDTRGNSDTTYINYAYPYVQKPVHSILRHNVGQTYNATSRLEWAIGFPKDSDMIEGDPFVVSRGYKSDYSDCVTLTSTDLPNYTSTTTENDSLFGWYSYTDNVVVDYSQLETTSDTLSAFDTWTLSSSAKAALSQYKYPARYLYYQVYRPTVISLWDPDPKFYKSWKMLQTAVMPTVDSVRIIKDAQYDKNHKVTIRVVLNNPYPWEVVPAADRAAVQQEAERQLFTRRMFAWDPKASIYISRYSAADEYDEGADVIRKDYTISGDQVQQDKATGAYYVEIEDIASVPFVHYLYKAKVETSGADYAICEDRNVFCYSTDECYSEQFGIITNLQATRGTIMGAVNVSWEADEFSGTTLDLQRRVYQRGWVETPAPGEWTTMAAAGGQATDDQASAAVVNEYILTITTKYRENIWQQSDTAYGYAGYYGKLSGRVQMPNGVNMPGDVHVNVNSSEPFQLYDVVSPKTGEIVLPACHYDSLKYDLPTDANGAYEMDSVPYYGSGQIYTVYATCQGATFVSPTGSAASINLTYEDANYEYTGIDFTCNDTKHFSGRVLFTNSTAPVRDAYIKVNGTILRNAEGEPVVTDAMGNFSFNVPRMEVSIQVVKPGHKLSNDGYILGGDNADQRTFTPTHDYDGLIIDDDTRVRLVGRIAGGDIQGNKPLGFGQSTNNLGDSITLVLALEGDHTSYLYFDKKNPDKLSYSQQYTQPVTTIRGTDQRTPTHVTYEAKRIVVKADNKTGEFCLDLLPTKYVIAQVYANGYSTLYSEGEGQMVIDLGDSIGMKTHYSDNTMAESTQYEASMRKIYHAPVKVDLLQMRSNKFQSIYGAESMDIEMVTGEKSMQLSWMDAEGKAQYALGYPVFKGNGNYFFQVQAYEPYYYNNVKSGRYQRVPMSGYPVSISNGLISGNGVEKDILTLNEAGCANYAIRPSNTTFTMTEEDALRYLSASVEIEGYHYESDVVAGYVTGEKDFGVEVAAAFESMPTIIDYIRDPYGTNSFAYREKGTTYSWAHHMTSTTMDVLTVGGSIGCGINCAKGLARSLGVSYSVKVDAKFNITLTNNTTMMDGEMTMKLNDRIATSADPKDQGAMADIYLGNITTMDVYHFKTLTVLDSVTWAMVSPAVEGGVVKLVRQGRNAQGAATYLAICDGTTYALGEERVFAYTQEHIINTLIPSLEARRDEAFRIASSLDEARELSAQLGRIVYYWNGSGYNYFYPATSQVAQDTVKMLGEQIAAWQQLIANNEKIKIDAMKGTPEHAYSVAGTTIEHSEQASTYFRRREQEGAKNWSFTIGAGSGQTNTPSMPGADAKSATKADQGAANNQPEQEINLENIAPARAARRAPEEPSNPGNKSNVQGFGALWSVNIGYQQNSTGENKYTDYVASTGGSGYTITATDNSYFDIDIYHESDSSILTVPTSFKDDINSYETGQNEKNMLDTAASGSIQMVDSNSTVHSYIYVMRSGATHRPWIDADSTFFYKPDGERLPLGIRTMRIDNPQIYVENPVVHNTPQDEKAIFTLHLTNETEMTSTYDGAPATMVLKVKDNTNPYGAKLYVDGQALGNGLEYSLSPGQSITKTLEVERGGKPYDYENIVLTLSDKYSIIDEAAINVYYIPTSTPVTLTQPAQNFLINTLSQQDEDGKYYIPVQMEGFSTTKYDNFDHIELQYKRQTDGEDQWVNQCSYYTDEALYKAATGTKAMITTEGKIANIRFYGEQDPVEQKYDLRAVSFCRLGNGYTTRMSSVISGTKDTRCPEVFGLPKPEDGILSFDDVISLPFTEPIAYNYLDETANFTVQGFTNNSDVDNSVALYFAGSESQKVVSTVDRVLNAMDFTVEMNVKVESEDPDSMVFIAINDDFSEQTTNTFVFGYNTKKDVLVSWMNNQVVTSKPLKATYGLTLSSAMTHVGMTYSIADSTIHFYVGEQEVDVADEFKGIKPVCHANGIVNIGTQLRGKMNNIRLWSKALNFYEMTSKYKKRLSANEANLLDYWPADEASGTTVKDIANGATLTLTDVSWSLPDGYSVNLDHQTMHILSDQALKYTRDSREDYTISFYFKVDALDGDANLFAAGSDALEETGKDKVRIRFIDGVLYFVSEGKQNAFGDDNTYASDATWHYLAVSVNHAQNKASLFIDGALVNQLDASNVGGVAGSSICYGDANMAAHIDQIQMWSISLPASYIKNYYNAGLTGKEKELQIYLPFEEEAMNSQGTMYTAFSPLNQVIIASTGEIAGDTVINETLVATDSKVIAPVRSSTGIENLPFTWKSTNNELQITINKANSEINNQHLSLVVRRVEDLNGNPMQNAQMWTTYVNRNVLTWLVPERAIILPYGKDTTITAAFTNASGSELAYTIDCTCPALTLSSTMGTIQPLGEKAITVNISNGLPPGVYQIMLNLTDENGLCSEQTINLRVTATAPDWQMTTDPAYNQSMNLIAEVKKQEQGTWTVDMCPKDKVAAFIGKECVGVANLSVDAEANSSRLFLTIRGKSDLAGEQVEFRLWEYLTGKTYILTSNPAVTFAAMSFVGTETPVDLRAYEMRVQTLSLNAGWNWVSLYVDPFAEKGLNNLFSNQKQLTISDVFRTPFGSTFASFQSNGLWENTLDNMALLKNNVYQIYAQHAANVEVSGSLYAEATITLDFTQSEWAQMAYLSEQSLPVRQVLGDFVPGSAKAPAGTIIKGYEDFAIATADGTWRGSLEYLRPGEGYFVRRNGLRDSITITFTNTSASAPARQMVHSTSSQMVNGKWSNSTFSMMPLVATWSDFQEGDMLLALVGKEVVAVGEATDALFFVSLHANPGEQIQFAKVRHGEVVAVTSRALKYDAEGQAGTVEQPYLIDFTETDPNAPIYDILGMKYEHLRTLGTRVMIQGTKKVLNK